MVDKSKLNQDSKKLNSSQSYLMSSGELLLRSPPKGGLAPFGSRSIEASSEGRGPKVAEGVKVHSPVIKVDGFANEGLLAKVVKKLAKRGKNAKGEENLLKALKKVDLSVKKNKVQGLSPEKLKKINSSVSGVSVKTPNPTASEAAPPSGGKQVDAESKTEVRQGKALSHTKLSLVPQTLNDGGRSHLGRKIGVASGTKLLSVAPRETLLALLANIIQKAKPLVRLKKVRVAGITHQKPIPLTRKQAETEAIKRILVNAKTRSEKSASVRLAKEFEEIYNLSLSNKTLTEIRELHKAADANKANLSLK